MAENKTLARPYARALFAYANEKNDRDIWSQLVDALAVIVKDKQVQPLITDPNISSKEIIEIIIDVIKACKMAIKPSIEETLKHFLQLLTYNKRLNLLPAIAAHYQELRARAEKLVSIDVFSAQPLNPAQSEKMQEVLAKRFQTNVDVTFLEKSELIGGVQVRKGNWVMDDSLLGKLKRLRNYVLSG
jgi:F-type H+-transporting ATPase subunit delta